MSTSAASTCSSRRVFIPIARDFIRTAIRNQLSTHRDEVKRSIVRQSLELGLRHFTREDLEAVAAAGETTSIKVLGLATIADDVPPELALSTISRSPCLAPFAPARKSRPRWRIAFAKPRVSHKEKHMRTILPTRCVRRAAHARRQGSGSDTGDSGRSVGRSACTLRPGLKTDRLPKSPRQPAIALSAAPAPQFRKRSDRPSMRPPLKPRRHRTAMFCGAAVWPVGPCLWRP